MGECGGWGGAGKFVDDLFLGTCDPYPLGLGPSGALGGARECSPRRDEAEMMLIMLNPLAF